MRKRPGRVSGPVTSERVQLELGRRVTRTGCALGTTRYWSGLSPIPFARLWSSCGLAAEHDEQDRSGLDSASGPVGMRR